MKTSRYTKGLFWLGVRGRAFNFIAVLLFLAGLYVLFFSLIGGGVLVALSIFLLIKGGQNDLHYKRKSGYIVYDGGI